MRTRCILLYLFIYCLVIMAPVYGADPYDELVKKIPRRPANAMTGSEFLRYTANMSPAKRELAILREIQRGNIPDYLRKLKPVSLQSMKNGRYVKATIFVMPDYAAIGSNEDSVRIPMNLYTATRLARGLGFTLPTRKMVNEIYAQSLRLDPVPLQPSKKMTSNDYYQSHNSRIEAQLKNQRDRLVAGHKKDIVWSNRLLQKPTAIAIYGWHLLRTGLPIQPLSTVHSADYADYSHGVRFVSEEISINGESKSIFDIFEDRTLWQLVSDEGRLSQIKNLMKRFI